MAEKVGKVARIAEIAPGVRLVTVAAVDPPALAFRGGQFVSVRCGEGGDLRRSYTIVSAPGAAGGSGATEVELLVKDVDGGVGTGFFAGLRAGDELHFTGPMGFFVADAAHAGDVALVATGVGIAAALPVIEETLGRAGESGRVVLEWGLLDGQPAYWTDRLDGFAAAHAGRFSWRLTRGAEWIAVHAALTDAVVALVPGMTAPVVYTVGNGDMIRKVRDALVAKGLDRRKQIRNEVFYPVMEGMK
jgi:ferredoxin-NADP reductase